MSILLGKRVAFPSWPGLIVEIAINLDQEYERLRTVLKDGNGDSFRCEVDQAYFAN